MKLTAVVIEDEFKLREVFIRLLEKNCPEIEIIGEAGNITDGYDLILLRKPAVVFLDIEMPKGTGFDLLSKFENIDFEIVFVSSYEHYAIQALRLSALDFILKPVLIEDIIAIPGRIKKAIELKESAFKYNMLQSNLKSPNKEKQIILQTRAKLESVTINKITYLKADTNYTHIFIEGKNKHVVSRILKDFEDMLCEESSHFIRIHKTYIVNINYIKTIERGDECFVTLKDHTRLEVSRRKKMALLERFNSNREVF
jgi:two-component system LytT family response regulator